MRVCTIRDCVIQITQSRNRKLCSSCNLSSMLILMIGLPGTGKSTISRALAERYGGFVIDKDVIRPALFGPSQIEYSVEQDDFCQQVMLETAEYLLTRRPELRVFLD